MLYLQISLSYSQFIFIKVFAKIASIVLDSQSDNSILVTCGACQAEQPCGRAEGALDVKEDMEGSKEDEMEKAMIAIIIY